MSTNKPDDLGDIIYRYLMIEPWEATPEAIGISLEKDPGEILRHLETDGRFCRAGAETWAIGASIEDIEKLALDMTLNDAPLFRDPDDPEPDVPFARTADRLPPSSDYENEHRAKVLSNHREHINTIVEQIALKVSQDGPDFYHHMCKKYAERAKKIEEAGIFTEDELYQLFLLQTYATLRTNIAFNRSFLLHNEHPELNSGEFTSCDLQGLDFPPKPQE